MKNKYILCLVLLLFCSNTYALNHQEYFSTHLETLIFNLNQKYFPGPLSQELGKVALARQILEDGLNKGPTYSAAGISIGGFNKLIAEASIFNWLTIGKVIDSEGGTFYSFRGEQANICSAIIISQLFDTYVDKFLKKHQKTWRLAKETSKAISCDVDSFELNHRFHNKLEPINIIEKADSLYGPNHESVKKIYKESSKTLDYDHGIIIRNPTKDELTKIK